MRMAAILAGLALAACAAAQADTVTLPVQRASVAYDDLSQEVVQVRFTPEGKRLLAEFTHGRIGRMVHLRVDGTVLVSAMLRGAIDGGSLQVTPGEDGFGGKTASQIVRRLGEGASVELTDDELPPESPPGKRAAAKRTGKASRARPRVARPQAGARPGIGSK